MPVFEERVEFDGDGCIRVSVVAFGQRHEVRLPRREFPYTVEEILRETRIPNWDRCQFRRGDGYTVETTTVVENGHVIYVLTKIKGNMPVYEEVDEGHGWVRVSVVAFGQRHEVRLPRREFPYTVEEILRETRIPNWDRCQFRRGDGYTVETTTVVENGHVIYVLTKIKGN